MKGKMNAHHIKHVALAAMLAAGLTACSESPVLVDTEFEDMVLKTPAQASLIQFAPFANRSTRADINI